MLYRECFQHLPTIERKRIVTPNNVVLRLNRGERPEPLPEELRRQIRNKLRTKVIHKYPTYPWFYEKIANYIGFPKEQIVLGAGIEEFIRTLMFLCCDPGQKAAVLWPTCAMYDIYAKAFGVRLAEMITDPNKPHWTIPEMTRNLSLVEPRIVFLPNPGQPVETCFSLEELRALARWCHDRDIVLAVDEAHYGFGAPTALPLVKEFDNVLVLRTFSKFFSAASIRVGFAVGQARVIKPLDAVRPSGEVTGPSMAIATILMDNITTLEDSARETAQARDWLRETLRTKLGVRASGRYGFSVLIDLESVTAVGHMALRLAKRGIYVKADFPPPVETCMLVACGSMHMMETFYTAFSEEFQVIRSGLQQEIVDAAS